MFTYYVMFKLFHWTGGDYSYLWVDLMDLQLNIVQVKLIPLRNIRTIDIKWSSHPFCFLSKPISFNCEAREHSIVLSRVSILFRFLTYLYYSHNSLQLGSKETIDVVQNSDPYYTFHSSM